MIVKLYHKLSILYYKGSMALWCNDDDRNLKRSRQPGRIGWKRSGSF